MPQPTRYNGDNRRALLTLSTGYRKNPKKAAAVANRPMLKQKPAPVPRSRVGYNSGKYTAYPACIPNVKNPNTGNVIASTKAGAPIGINTLNNRIIITKATE